MVIPTVDISIRQLSGITLSSVADLLRQTSPQNYVGNGILLKELNTKIDTKINMELCLQKTLEDGKQNQASTNQINENKEEVPDIDKALFKHIKENDQKQWKNSETSQNQNLSSDY